MIPRGCQDSKMSCGADDDKQDAVIMFFVTKIETAVNIHKKSCLVCGRNAVIMSIIGLSKHEVQKKKKVSAALWTLCHSC